MIDMHTEHACLTRVQWPTLSSDNVKFDLGKLWEVFQAELPFEETMLTHRAKHVGNVSLASLASNTLGIGVRSMTLGLWSMYEGTWHLARGP